MCLKDTVVRALDLDVIAYKVYRVEKVDDRYWLSTPYLSEEHRLGRDEVSRDGMLLTETIGHQVKYPNGYHAYASLGDARTKAASLTASRGRHFRVVKVKLGQVHTLGFEFVYSDMDEPVAVYVAKQLTPLEILL